MLSKNNKILIGCLALLLVMSVGYALFSDTITINGTATAKGEFELTTTCDTNVVSALGNGHTGENGSVTDATITCNGNVVTASGTLGYPGSEKWFRVKVTNTGTIPAKLKKIVELNNPEGNIISKEENTYTIESYVTNVDKTNVAWMALWPGSGSMMDYETTDDDTVDSWTDQIFESVLEPGETAYFYVEMSWSATSTTPGEPLTPSINVEMDWEQITE